MRDITIIIPVYNEERILRKNLPEIYNGISKKFPDRCRFVIVDSNSTDKTPVISKEFARKHKDVSYINVDCDGKGGKIIYTALRSNTPYSGWIDSDIPLKMEEYYMLMDNVIYKNADIAIASRYAKGAKIKRHFMRLLLSKLYHNLVRMLFLINATDSSCGAKFWNRKITKNVWPSVKGQKWFFDTELVYYSVKKGYNLVEVPVTFMDRNDSRFNVLKEGFKVGLEVLNFRLRTLFGK